MQRRKVHETDGYILYSFIAADKNGGEAIHFTLQQTEEESYRDTAFRLKLTSGYAVEIATQVPRVLSANTVDTVAGDLLQAKTAAKTMTEAIVEETEKWVRGERPSPSFRFELDVDSSQFGDVTYDEFRELVDKAFARATEANTSCSGGSQAVDGRDHPFMRWSWREVGTDE